MANLLELMRMAKGNGAAPAAPAARLAHEPFVFWSGIDYPGEFHALMERRVPFGIATVPSGPGRKGMSLDDFEQLLRLLRSTRDSRSSAPIFVDSGAYRETSGTTYTEADWDQVLDRYRRVAEAAGPGASGAPPRVFVVAPDVVGSFSGTEARLAGRGPQLKALVALGAHILLPIQPGPGTLQEREARLRTAAGFGPAGSSSSRDLQGREAVHPALPWTKKAKPHPSLESVVRNGVTSDSVAAFLRATHPDRVHFLGVSEKSNLASAPQGTWPQIVATVTRASPGTQLQSDANKLGAMTAEGRPYTRAGVLVDEGALSLRPFDEEEAGVMDADGNRLGSSTDNVVNLASWTTPKERARIADAAGLDEKERALFVLDPDAFFAEQGSVAVDHPFLYDAIDDAWVDYAERFASTGLRQQSDRIGDRRRHLQVRHLLREPPAAHDLLAWVEKDSGRSVTDPEVAAWLSDVAKVTVHGQGAKRQLRMLRGISSPEGARRRLNDALTADEGIGALFALSDPKRAASFREEEQRRIARKALEPKEAAALDKALKRGSDFVFAFGSNLRRAQMAERVPGSIPVARATLARHRLAFAGNSRTWGGPVATVVPADWGEGGPVYGALYALPPGGIEQLDRYEGVPHVYTRVKRDVRMRNHHTVSAWVYVHTAPEGGAPTPAYRDAIEAGRREWAIEAEAIAASPAGPAARPAMQASPARPAPPAPPARPGASPSGMDLLSLMARARK